MQINIHTCEIGHKILGQIPKYQSREFTYVKISLQITKFIMPFHIPNIQK